MFNINSFSILLFFYFSLQGIYTYYLLYYFLIIVTGNTNLIAEERCEKSFAVLRDKRRAGDFTIPKIDNSKQAFYGVATKLHDAFPRPHVSQDVLGFVQRPR